MEPKVFSLRPCANCGDREPKIEERGNKIVVVCSCAETYFPGVTDLMKVRVPEKDKGRFSKEALDDEIGKAVSEFWNKRSNVSR